jgi:hypothetical protein
MHHLIGLGMLLYSSLSCSWALEVVGVVDLWLQKTEAATTPAQECSATSQEYFT